MRTLSTVNIYFLFSNLCRTHSVFKKAKPSVVGAVRAHSRVLMLSPALPHYGRYHVPAGELHYADTCTITKPWSQHSQLTGLRTQLGG